MAARLVQVPAVPIARLRRGRSAAPMTRAASRRAAASWRTVAGWSGRHLSVSRMEPMSVETPPSPVTISVLPPPTSTTTVAPGSGIPSGGAREHQSRLLLAADDVGPEPQRPPGGFDELFPVGGVPGR